MPKISSLDPLDSIPDEIPTGEVVDDKPVVIQVNACKLPTCKNFGKPPEKIKPFALRATTAPDSDYTLNRFGEYNANLKCLACKEILPVKSNLAIYEEWKRISAYLKPDEESSKDPTRHKDGCPEAGASVLTSPKKFRFNAKPKKGDRIVRYECKACRATFSVRRTTIVRQRKSHLNKWIFKLLVNKVPLQRICELVEIEMRALYRKIDFIHAQCMAFVAARERRLLETGPLVDNKPKPKRYYLCVDRQEYVVNWGKIEDQDADRRNVKLKAIASADLKTGYVMGMHLNFDPVMDRDDVNNRKIKINGDEKKPAPYREFARVWLEKDYQEAAAAAEKRKMKGVPEETPFAHLIEDSYEESEERELEGDVENPEVMSEEKKLPDHGMQVHEEYTIYGHFQFLRRLSNGVEKVRFYLDREPAIRAACHSAFKDLIDSADCEVFFVKADKVATIGQKRAAYSLAESRFAAEAEKMMKENPKLRAYEVRLQMLLNEMGAMEEKGKWKDLWLHHPFPDMSEPNKAVCYLTNKGTYDGDPDHLAWLYGKASLHAVNRFFLQLRRRVSMLERPIRSASSQQRSWFGYSPYNPEMIQKLIDIFRVFYNYVKETEVRKRRKKKTVFYTEPIPPPPGEDHFETGEENGEKTPPKRMTTPAMRLGLARAPITYEDILYFKE